MTRRKVLWAISARRDLESIVSWLADRSPQAALSTLDRLEARAKSLATLADRGRVVPELGRIHIQQYRELVHHPVTLSGTGLVLSRAVYHGISRKNRK